MKVYKLEKDIYINKWIVFEIHRNYWIDVFKGYKYDCQRWLKHESKRKNIRII